VPQSQSDEDPILEHSILHQRVRTIPHCPAQEVDTHQPVGAIGEAMTLYQSAPKQNENETSP
jgi:hypothetical protein